ncbi:MAG: rod shape-determining protein MreC [Patescibacteria group bacterium]|nr:rod shape-determining protein MreC [Patescibacteria group bacterium]
MTFKRNSGKNNNSFNDFFSSNSSSKTGIVIFLIIVAFVLNLSFTSKSIKGFFYSISEPIQYWLWEKGIKSSDFFKSILNSQNLKKENDFLKFENQKLISENILLEELKTENQLLKTALDLDLEKEFELDLVDIIAKTNDYLIINKGYEQDVDIAMPVITENKVLVGKIVELFQNTAKVELLSSKNSSFDVEILKKDIYSLAKGEGDFEIILDLIPNQENIETGDKVITSSLGGNFPKELLVGSVDSIKKSDVTAFQEIKVKPSFNLSTTKTLFIIKNFTNIID